MHPFFTRETLPFLATLTIILLCAACTTTPLPPNTAHALASPVVPTTGACSVAARQDASPRSMALAAAAREEHAAWGGQELDAEGRLLAAGVTEAENAPGGQGRAPWERVLGYWRAVDPSGSLPSLVYFGALRPADRRLLHEGLNTASAERLQGLGVGPDQGLSAADLSALHTTLDRVSVIDSPWSAAFVSWLVREVGLGADAFTFSEAHADYAASAWTATQQEQAGVPTSYALRACDLTTTPARVGDLVCQTRGTEMEADTFDKLGRLLALRAASGIAAAPLPMHCDVVTQVDARGFDAVGGNVLQAVTRRRLDFAPGTRLLDPSYLWKGCAPGAPGCVDRHMSRQPWSLLLQWR